MYKRKYIRRPVVVEAATFMVSDEYDIDKLVKFTQGKAHDFKKEHKHDVFPYTCLLDTPMGTIKLNQGCYIVKDENGNFYPYESGIFEKMYSELANHELGHPILKYWSTVECSECDGKLMDKDDIGIVEVPKFCPHCGVALASEIDGYDEEEEYDDEEDEID